MNIINQRAKSIRAATPDCLEELFEMQDRLCDLCGCYIQDIILASLDHSVPVNLYAKNLNISLSDAVSQCNDRSNLRAVHFSCNSSKNCMTRDDWFLKGLDRIIKEPKVYTEQDLLSFKNKLTEIGRLGGKKAVESGQIYGIKTYESSLKGALNQKIKDKIRGGRTSGLQNIENGHLSRIRKERSDRINKEKLENPKPKISIIRDYSRIIMLGKIARHSRFGHSGLADNCIKCNRSEKEKKLAHLESSRLYNRKNKKLKTKEYLDNMFRSNGHNQGIKNIENGVLAKASHVRWHEKRGIVSQNCKICLGKIN